MAFKLEPLKYDYDALEPVIDEKTMRVHHDKHHQGYVNNLNKAIEGTEWDDKSLEDILKNLDSVDEKIRTAVTNNVGGVYNHNLFWESMVPGGSKEPVGTVKELIEKKWGSFDAFKEEFEKKGAGRFGSGWVNLVKEGDDIKIVSNPNQDCPVSHGQVVLLGNDVWEHAYYLKYQNRRAEYLKEWWKVVNWDVVEERYHR